MSDDAPLLVIDRAASTVLLAGRRFPAVSLICPPEPDREDQGDFDRALGVGGGDQSVYVPAENGLLFQISEESNEHRHGLSLYPHARTCELVHQTDASIWLPWTVGIFDGKFVLGRSNVWVWAEPEWVVETIDRLSRKPFTQPDGPPVRLVRLNHFEESHHV